MSDNVTQEGLNKALKTQTDEILGVLQTFMFQVDERFNKLETRMDEFDRKLNKLTDTIDGFVARIDHYETEQTARDSQFEKLLAWARKVSEKTGIPLENL